ncbi:transposase [Brevibacterium paucivorans]|uniref:Transposase n=1 Tax=Brevibacterium paucivorans TaxID=170994 RepID=A0ABS2SIX4_9MICO|nr:transposase [Brevibacterium paucivorans]
MQAAFDEAYGSVVTITARRDRLDERITAMAENSPYTDVVRRLGCLRGISTLTGLGLAVEIGGWSRFSGNSIGSYLGLVPSENSSGQSRSLGPITKTGDGHARRLLVEVARHHQHRYVVGKMVRDRWDLASPVARARGDLGNRRLNKRWMQFKKRKKPNNVANAAIARELAGWCWSLAVLEE